MQIEWTPPKTRNGWRGYWDAFVGPGATNAEEWLQLLGGLLLSVLALFSFFLRFPGEPTLVQISVVALLAFDVSGGIITNATSTAKRWYHRAGQGLQQHLLFVLPHGLHIALLVWLFPGYSWWYFVICYVALMTITLLILRTPLYLQRPVAFTCYAGVLLVSLMIGATPGLEWVIPLLFLKLLISHLLKEAPFRPEAEPQP